MGQCSELLILSKVILMQDFIRQVHLELNVAQIATGEVPHTYRVQPIESHPELRVDIKLSDRPMSTDDEE